jgi:hypothetical protein
MAPALAEVHAADANTRLLDKQAKAMTATSINGFRPRAVHQAPYPNGATRYLHAK